MAGQHLAMRVNIHALALALLEQVFQVLQIVAGDENRLALDGADIHHGRLGMAIGLRVGPIEQLHDLQVHLAGLQDPAQNGVEVGRRAPGTPGRRGNRGPRGIGHTGRIFVAQHQGVIGVGRGPFQSVERQFQQAGNVGPQDRLELGNPHLFALPDQTGAVGRRLPGGGPQKLLRRLARLDTGRFVKSAGLVAGRCGLGQVFFNSGRVEIDVGHRGEQAFEHGPIDLRVANAELGRSMGVHRQSLGGMDQEVLQGGGLRFLAANADLLAPGALGGLFALVTKHVGIPFS